MIRTHYIGEIDAGMNGEEVTIAGWVHEVRETARITFLLVRDRSGIVQVIGKAGDAPEDVMRSMKLQKESVVKIVGTVKANSEAKKGFEIVPKSVENLNPLSAMVPFEVTGKVPAEMDVRLNYRYVDLRRRETSAIFSVEATVLRSFRDIANRNGFVEIRPPSMIEAASEGGADLFTVDYFEQKAYMAQSPQLYKQLAVIGGMDRVTMITPVWRAEKSNTVYHLTESTQMDVEMGFADAGDAISLLKKTVAGIVKDVLKKNKDDIATLNPSLAVPKVKTVTYSRAVKGLQGLDHKIEFGHDFSREHEAALEKLYGDAVVITDFPTSIRAFYSMPKEGNPELSNSFDFIYKGLEISSGAQRIHKPDMLMEALRRKGLDPKAFEDYVNAFRCGAPPHAGWSIGMERFVMRITGAANIRECSMFPRDRMRLRP